VRAFLFPTPSFELRLSFYLTLPSRGRPWVEEEKEILEQLYREYPLGRRTYERYEQILADERSHSLPNYQSSLIKIQGATTPTERHAALNDVGKTWNKVMLLHNNSLIQHRKPHPAQTSARRADYPPSELDRDNQRAASLQEVKARHGIERIANALETFPETFPETSSVQ
jgi:hypothetical protein